MRPRSGSTIAPHRAILRLVDAATQRAIAAKLQPQLLDYRLTNSGRVRGSDFDIPTFSPNLRIIARALGACIVDAPELQAAVAPLLEGQQELLRSNRLLDPQCVTLEALLTHCHGDQASGRIGVGEIASTATAILMDRGETAKLEAKATGNLLRMLGFNPKRDTGGYALSLTEDLRHKIHILARDYEVTSSEQPGTTCSHCAEVMAVGGLENEARLR